jgi:hypothetical protein
MKGHRSSRSEKWSLSLAWQTIAVTLLVTMLCDDNAMPGRMG